MVDQGKIDRDQERIKKLIESTKRKLEELLSETYDDRRRSPETQEAVDRSPDVNRDGQV